MVPGNIASRPFQYGNFVAMGACGGGGGGGTVKWSSYSKRNSKGSNLRLGGGGVYV